MMRRPFKWLTLLLLVPLLVGGCKDEGTEPEPDPVVSGSWSGSSPGLTLNLTLIEDAAGGADTNFTGQMTSATQIVGTLNGSGFNGFTVSLTKR